MSFKKLACISCAASENYSPSTTIEDDFGGRKATAATTVSPVGLQKTSLTFFSIIIERSG
jgi:hypothetical protein